MQWQAVLTTVLSITWLMSPAFADAELAAYASEARVEVRPRDEKRAIRLPKIDFPVRAEFACSGEAVAESVTISIADAFHRHAPTGDDNSLDAVITVPANQIAPIVAGDFCATGDNEEKAADEGLLLSGVATAQVSLRCVAQGNRSVSFASLNLPLRLVCKSDQDPSAGVPSPAR